MDLKERTLWTRLHRKLSSVWHKRQGTGYPEIGVGLVGAGNVVRWKYLPLLRARPRMRLVSVYDVNFQAAQSVAEMSHSCVAESFESLVRNPQVRALLVCTPPEFHAEAVLQALKAGKHVLCEKPMADSLVQAQAMAALARQTGLVNMIHFAYRFSPEWRLVRQLLRSGALGRLYTFWGTLSQGGWYDEHSHRTQERSDATDWRYDKRGGIIFEMGSHLADLCRWCFGEVLEVRAWKQALREDSKHSEDLCGAVFGFEGGLMGQVELSRLATGYRERGFLEVYGSRGSLKYDQGGVSIWTREVPRWRTLLTPTPAASFLDVFHQAIATPAQTTDFPTFEDGLKNQQILDAILASAASGVPIPLNHD